MPTRTSECFLFEWDGAIARAIPQRGAAMSARELLTAVNTRPLNYVPVKQLQMARFDGRASSLMVQSDSDRTE